jgi:hypothetical protein
MVRANDKSDGEETLFAKQYVDRTGIPQEKHWRSERLGSRMACDVLNGAAFVPQVRYASEEHLVNIFDYQSVLSIDEILRSDPQRFERSIGEVIANIRNVLENLTRIENLPGAEDLAVKTREFGSRTALLFAGFEIRNIGLDIKSADSSDIVIFDCGQPYLAPVEEAAAKIIVSIGLLNWGKPMSRFIYGPDLALLDIAIKELDGFIDSAAIWAEFERERRHRLRTAMGAHFVESAVKRVGIQTIGRWYLQSMANFFEQRLD